MIGDPLELEIASQPVRNRPATTPEQFMIAPLPAVCRSQYPLLRFKVLVAEGNVLIPEPMFVGAKFVSPPPLPEITPAMTVLV